MIDREPFEQVINYAQAANIVQKNLLGDIRRLQYIRNEITHRGSMPSRSDAKSAANLAKRVVRAVARASIKPIKWTVSYGLNVSNLIEDDSPDLPKDVPRERFMITEWLKKQLFSYLDTKELDYQMEEEEDNGETYGIRISFYWDRDPKELPIDDVHPWELLEFQPYVKVYDD
jgi:hypothetical protein